MSKGRASGAAVAILAAALLTGCYAYQWSAPGRGDESVAPAPGISALFQAAGGVLTLEMEDPGSSYAYDPGELDSWRGADEQALRFRRAELRLRDRMPPGKVEMDLRFTAEGGARVSLVAVDLLRLVPRLDTHGDLQYPELLLEEFERTGVVFRREHGEFAIEPSAEPAARQRDALARVYRVGLFNNCLDPTKWEFILTSEELADFEERLDGDLYLDTSKILAHSWFYLDRDLYTALLRVKNPHLEIDPSLAADYDALSRRAQEVVVDFSQLREVAAEPYRTEVLEIGHHSGRRLEPLIAEQHYKWDLGLFLDRAQVATYADLSRRPVRVAQFADRGTYQPDNPRTFDYAWLARLDRVEVRRVEQPDTDCYVEIVLSGDGLPFRLTLGNLDLAQLDEQRFVTLAFGINPYPKGRRYNPAQSTISYDADLMPERLMPYLLLTDGSTGRWVNNIDQGVEMAYVGWESIDKNILEIYLLSYERITPVWMARVELTAAAADMTRVRRALYTY